MQTDKTKFFWRGELYWVRQLDSVSAVIDETDILFEGWQVLCDRRGARADVEWDDYLQRILAIANRGLIGAIFVYYSKNHKHLGYTVVLEDTESRKYPTLFIYAGYSVGRLNNAGKLAMDFVTNWAKLRGYKEVRAQSRRLSGAAMRYFRKSLGFTILSVVFKKDV